MYQDISITQYTYNSWAELFCRKRTFLLHLYSFTGHNAPLYGRAQEKFEDHPGYMFSVFDTLKIWMDAGAPAEKLLMGFAQYGRGMTLNFTDLNGLYCPAYDGRLIKTIENIWSYKQFYGYPRIGLIKILIFFVSRYPRWTLHAARWYLGILRNSSSNEQWYTY